MRPSEKFTKVTGKDGLYNIQAIENMPSIMRKGLLSNERAKKLAHKSIAMNEIQARRDLIQIPNGMKLHQYANLYFDYWNPMLSRERDQNENICILKFDKAVLDFSGVILSDRNASSNYAAFYSVEMGLEKIDFNLVYSKYWTDEDYFKQLMKKSVKCAEVLIPHYIPFDYVMCAAVVNEVVKNKLRETGFNREILVKPSAFF